MPLPTLPPLRRQPTLIFHPPTPPMSHDEYLQEIRVILPHCDPSAVDIELTRFCEHFRAQLLGGANISPSHDARTPFAPSLAPAWMASPDERRDKLGHLRVHAMRVVNKEDDDVSNYRP